MSVLVIHSLEDHSNVQSKLLRRLTYNIRNIAEVKLTVCILPELANVYREEAGHE